MSARVASVASASDFTENAVYWEERLRLAIVYQAAHWPLAERDRLVAALRRHADHLDGNRGGQ